MTNADLVLRLLLAAGLGPAIGLEREIHRKPAGLPTQILIALGSALLTVHAVAAGAGEYAIASVATADHTRGAGRLPTARELLRTPPAH